MKRDSRTILLSLVALTVVLSGCVPLGPRRGKEQVVAKRTDADGSVTEKMVGVPTEHHWMLLFTPEGPELNYITSETWRFYVETAEGKREQVSFLKKRGGNVMPWNIIAPIQNTKLWVAVVYTGSLREVEDGHYTYRVICFTSKKIMSDKRLDYPEYGTFSFDSERNVLTYATKKGSYAYDPLASAR